jgi:uncharacterized membrane protein
VAYTKIVIALFFDEASADFAVERLKTWDELTPDIRLNAIGVLVLDKSGKVKEHKLGRHDTGKGAGIGFVLGALAVTAATAGVGLAVGAVAGRLVHKGLGLSLEDRSRLAGELQGGKAAVGVLAGTDEADRVAAKLAELGGTPEIHQVDTEALAQEDAIAAEGDAQDA